MNVYKSTNYLLHYVRRTVTGSQTHQHNNGVCEQLLLYCTDSTVQYNSNCSHYPYCTCTVYSTYCTCTSLKSSPVQYTQAPQPHKDEQWPGAISRLEPSPSALQSSRSRQRSLPEQCLPAVRVRDRRAGRARARG